jgi:hypothetical protein
MSYTELRINYSTFPKFHLKLHSYRTSVFFVLIGNKKNDLNLTMKRQQNGHYKRQYFVIILMYHVIKPIICEIISMSKTV